MVKVVLISLLLVACSPIDFIKPMLGGGDGPSLEVDTTVGDKEEAVVGSVGSQEIAADTISGGVNTTTIQDIPPWVMLLLVLGWLLPSHTEIYREIKSWFKRKT